MDEKKAFSLFREFLSNFLSPEETEEIKAALIKNNLYLFNKELFELEKQIEKNSSLVPRYLSLKLGSFKNYKFHPSLPLLKMLSEKTGQKIKIDKKSAYLFTCGRDIFEKSVLDPQPKAKKRSLLIITDENETFLGMGKAIENFPLKERKSRTAVKNILDIGDYLRREMN